MEREVKSGKSRWRRLASALGGGRRGDAHYSTGGLAAVVDERCRNGALTEPTAVVVLELRGMAADTIVEGARAWSGPLGVLNRRLLDGLENGRVARLGPHTFGAVVGVADGEGAVAVGERLVALCRQPVPTGLTEVRVEAVAGVCHRHVGQVASGEEMIREADASLRLGPSVASPVVNVDRRLRDYALRVMAVESQIRHGLDTDLFASHLAPVVDVRRDEVVCFRSSPDWTRMSAVDPAVLADVAAGLGLRRSVDSQFLLSTIAAVGAANTEPGPGGRVVATVDAARFTDPRMVSQINLLLEVAGLSADQLVVELDQWTLSGVAPHVIDDLAALGVGIGMRMRHVGGWQCAPRDMAGRVETVAVDLGDLLRADGSLALDRVEELWHACGRLDMVSVVGVDDPSSALELSAVGLTLQTGRVHGQAMSASDMREWILERDG